MLYLLVLFAVTFSRFSLCFLTAPQYFDASPPLLKRRKFYTSVSELT